MFMYWWKNWDLGFTWNFEIGIWGLDLDLGHGIWDLRFLSDWDLRFTASITSSVLNGLMEY